jgi:hypothetical protein
VDVQLERVPAARLQGARRRARGRWFAFRRTRSGEVYLRWNGLVECLVAADGRRIRYRPLPGSSDAAMVDYVLGTVLSFSLVARGADPLHAATVLVNGRAVGFLGDSGAGKSTLAAAMLARGNPLLTDDLLALTNGGRGYLAHPGPRRIKLYPRAAHAILGPADGTPMNPATSKSIFALARGEVWPRPAPLAALYVLERAPGRERARSEPVTRAAAVIEIVRAAFNLLRTDRDRLVRQFTFASRLVATIPVRRLRVPRDLAALPGVCAVVEREVAS